jgi:hypothetical protein
MKSRLHILSFTVSLIIKAALLAAEWSGRRRKRALEEIAFC